MSMTLKLVQKRQLTDNIYELVLEGDSVLNMRDAGQFLHIQVPRKDLLLRRPISLSQIDGLNQRCTIVIRDQGHGTHAIVEAPIGFDFDVLGPLGNGFPLHVVQTGQKVLLIGGGLGVPPLLECAKQLHEMGVECTIVLGFTSVSTSFYLAEFSQYGIVHVTSDDGSIGLRGHVGVMLDQLDLAFDAIYACGPQGLNKMVNERFKDHPNAYLSLEERMACGMGACHGCTLMRSDQQSNVRVCKDGPVFRCGEVSI